MADYFKDQFGSISHFGGNGTTTFNVPDLRGEFLRGSGVNGHANQGSGADPGVHQNATQVPRMWADGNKNIGVAHLASIINYDTGVGSAYNFFVYGTDKNNYGPSYQSLTVRPTNTSILWCIKAEPTYYMKVEGRYDFTLNRKKFIGYWIDGKPLYEKVIKVPGSQYTGSTSPYQVYGAVNVENYETIMVTDVRCTWVCDTDPNVKNRYGTLQNYNAWVELKNGVTSVYITCAKWTGNATTDFIITIQWTEK